jgi:hypothetical protein
MVEILVDYTMVPEYLSKKKIFIIIWVVAIILSGTFTGTNFSKDWIQHVTPWLASEKLSTDEEHQVQIPASNLEYALWVAVLDNTSIESKSDIETTYVTGSIQVFFNNEIEVVYNGSEVVREFDDPEGLTLHAPAAFSLIYPFKNPSDPLNIRIIVLDASASVQSIWWVRIFRNDKPLIPFIEGFVLGSVGISIVCAVIYGFLFVGKNQNNET